MEKQDGETEVKDELVSILCRTLKLLLYCCLIIHVPEQKRKKYVNTKNWKKEKKNTVMAGKYWQHWVYKLKLTLLGLHNSLFHF